jgi:hypothetical protein
MSPRATAVLISSSTTISRDPDTIRWRARAIASAADRLCSDSGFASPLQLTNPLPKETNSRSGVSRSDAFASPVGFELLMNWITETDILWPKARKAIPRAALVFPFPSPVNTMISPLSRMTPLPVSITVEGLRMNPAGKFAPLYRKKNDTQLPASENHNILTGKTQEHRVLLSRTLHFCVAGV